MAKSNFIILMISLLVVLNMITQSQSLIPYPTRNSILDLMFPQTDSDPFRILEQSPLNLPKGLESSSSSVVLALARADWKETKSEHIISLDVPGMKKEDIKIEVEENRVLRVSGERKIEDEEIEGDKWHRAERITGKFWRQFRLPGNADLEKIRANLENGVLRISVPKLGEEKKKQAKVISIAEDVEEGIKSGGEDIKATKAELK